jgi:hypothetical protein
MGFIFGWNGFFVEVSEEEGHHGGHGQTVKLFSIVQTSVSIDDRGLWSSFAAAYPEYAGAGYFHEIHTKGGNDEISRRAGGSSFGNAGNDVFNDFATAGTGQIHSFGGGGNDTMNLYFDNVGGRYSHGHHNRGDDPLVQNGFDSFNFLNTSSVSKGEVVVGRLEDYDLSRDTIRVDGKILNLNSLPTNIKIVLHNGDHNDPGAQPQQWLVIKTSTGGYIVYTLEGARIDMNSNGGANGGMQEAHFIEENVANINQSAAYEIVDIFERTPSAKFIDPQDNVPAGMIAQGGITWNDVDRQSADVASLVSGTVNGDLIAAGLNNDTVAAGAGNDRVWGGNGDDVVNGETGDDTLAGNRGNDFVNGGNGDDLIIYHEGADTIIGGAGDDTLEISGDFATKLSLSSNSNNLGITFTEIENVSTGGGADTLMGNAGANSIFGNSGNDVLSGYGGNDSIYGGVGNDLMVGDDSNDLKQDGALFYIVQDLAPHVNASTPWPTIFDHDDFLFGGAGVDRLFGGHGNDLLDGGDGADRLHGGSGADRFTHSGRNGEGTDLVLDYDWTEGDVLIFKGAASGREDFSVSTSDLLGVGAQSIPELLIQHIPSGRVIWTLQGVATHESVMIDLGGQVLDLLI